MTQRKTAGLVAIVLVVLAALWWVQSKLSGIFGQM
jgi:hypothetical protein